MRAIPTLTEIYNDIIADFEAQFGVTLPTFGKNFLRIMAAAQAAKLKLFYLAIGSVQKNIFVDTAESETIGGTLERFGRVKLNRNPFPATSGKYEITVTGEDGAIIPAQTTFKSNDDSQNPGKLYILDSQHTMVGTSDTIIVRSLETGVDVKLTVGDKLTATAPIALVNSIATVATETQEPAAAESLEDYRKKTLDAYRLEPQGGAATDYRLWSFDAQGVRQSYPYAKSGADYEINLYVEATAADSTDGKGTPSSALLLAVEDVVEFDPDTTRPTEERGRRPLQAIVNFLPVTIREVDIVINGYVNRTAEIESALISAINTEINKIRPFVSACDILSEKNDILDANKVIATILNTRPGSVFGAVGITVDGTPYTSFTFINGDIPYVNSVSFA